MSSTVGSMLVFDFPLAYSINKEPWQSMLIRLTLFRYKAVFFQVLFLLLIHFGDVCEIIILNKSAEFFPYRYWTNVLLWDYYTISFCNAFHIIIEWGNWKICEGIMEECMAGAEQVYWIKKRFMMSMKWSS